jgi:branched-chain amino acid transport system ATP-binding protein
MRDGVPTSTDTALEARNVTVRFGGMTALNRISVSAHAGTITGLIGPNGAGKTTLFNVVCGLLSPDSGRIVLDGHDITRQAPHRRARRGLARTFQRLELFTSLTVRDNVRVGGDIHNRWNRGGREAPTADEILALTGLRDLAGREVSEIPTGQARVVELARALMTRPRVVLLDEPAAGQSDEETEAFGPLLRRLAGDGLAILLVEHDMSLVMDVCEIIHVLDYGRMIAVGSPDEVRADPGVVEAYLGTPDGAPIA